MKTIVMVICSILAFAKVLQVEGSVDQDIQKIIHGDGDFSVALYYSLSTRNTRDIVFSPMGIRASLGLIFMGTKGNTAKILAKLTRFPEDKETVAKAIYKILQNLSENSSFNITNRIFVTKAFRIDKEFEEIAKNKFFATIEIVDFSKKTSDDEVNRWINQTTSNKLIDPKFEESFSAKPDFALINTVNFKGGWLQGSNVEISSPQPFTVSKTLTMRTKMIGFDGTYRLDTNKDLGAHVLEMPFKRVTYPTMYFVVFLPFDVYGLQKVEDRLQGINLTKMLMMTKATTQNLSISIPQFRQDRQIVLDQGTAYKSDVDFSGLSQSAMPVGRVVHRVVLTLDWKGVAAATASEAIDNNKKRRPQRTRRETRRTQKKMVVLNHPFIYVIRCQNMEILFMGRYTRPWSRLGNNIPINEELEN